MERVLHRSPMEPRPGTPLSRFYAAIVDQRTGSGWRIASLDGLRGIAAMMVLVAHVHQRVDPSPSLAWAPLERGGLGGVILFFALSGFLLYLPWLRSEVESKAPPRFRSYAIRRCLRIMPAYYASVIAIVALRAVFGARDPLSAGGLVLHFLFLPTLIAPLQTVYWTLQVEEFFYWLLPGLHRLRMRIGALGVLGLACLVSATWAAIGFIAIRPDMRGTWLENTPFFLPAFALGIVTAVRWRSPGLSGRTLVIGGALAYIAMTPFALHLSRQSEQWVPITEVLIAPAASAVVLGVARGGARVLEHPVLRFLGAISFSIYLWHMVVIRIVPLPPVIAHSFGLRLLATIALTVPVALLSYLCVERPFLKLRPDSHAVAAAR
jgi:acetyltransferase